MEIKIKTTKHDQVIDITDKITQLIKQEETDEGICYIFVKHTTCCLTTADLDPGTDIDFLNFLRKISPDLNYKHPHDPKHAPDHLLSSIIGSSIFVPIKNGKLDLGTWQKIVLVELSGPRERSINVTIIDE